MFQCHRCHKMMSSQQAIDYHIKKNVCKQNSQVNNLKKDCNIHLECTSKGIILDSTTVVRDAQFKQFHIKRDLVGMSIYEFIKETNKYVFARNHVDCISCDGSLQRFSMSDPDDTCTCLLYYINDTFHVFYFKNFP
jgi:hypothetical protein